MGNERIDFKKLDIPTFQREGIVLGVDNPKGGSVRPAKEGFATRVSVTTAELGDPAFLRKEGDLPVEVTTSKEWKAAKDALGEGAQQEDLLDWIEGRRDRAA